MKATRRSQRPRPRLLDPFLWLVAALASYLLARLVITLIDELPHIMELK